MATYRERREARAARLREWAEKREAKQAALNEAARADEEATGIPFGQPILVGHHSERRHRRRIEQIDRGMRAAVDNSRRASAMAARADSIEAQAENAIYTDDPDAKERLAEKIAALEAERDVIKAYNASCRKAAKTGGVGDVSLLTDELRRDIAATARAASYMLGAGGQFPRYKLTNLSANIGRLRKRLEGLDRARERQQAGRIITARYGGPCADCGAQIERGQQIRYSRADGARCVECPTTEGEEVN